MTNGQTAQGLRRLLTSIWNCLAARTRTSGTASCVVAAILYTAIIAGCAHTSYYASVTAAQLDEKPYGGPITPLPNDDCDLGCPCKPYDSVFDDEHIAKQDYRRKSLIPNICANRSTVQESDPKTSDQRLSVAVIEFDDDGLHWDPDQVTQVEREIVRVSQAQMENKLNSEGIILFVFIHGWRHNASEGSTNLRDFRRWAKTLAQSDDVCFHASPDEGECTSRPHVLAVYIGWRGDSLGLTNRLTSRWDTLGRFIKTPQYLTFWSRKRSARALATTPLTTTIYRLLAEVQNVDNERRKAMERNRREALEEQRREAQNEKPSDRDSEDDGYARYSMFPASKSIFIGHSFGAKALEYAMAQSFVGARAMSQKLMAVEVGDEIREVNNMVEERKDLRAAIDDRWKSIKKIGEAIDHLNGLRSDLLLAIEGLNSEIEAVEGSILRAEQDIERYQRDQTAFRPRAHIVACDTYDQNRVVQCGSLQRQGLCAIREVNCLYASYSSSIRAKLSEADASGEPTVWTRTGVSDPLKVVSEAAFEGFMDQWVEFEQRLSNFQKRVAPSNEFIAESADSNDRFATTTSLLAELEKPLIPHYNFKFSSGFFLEDPTTDVERSLMNALTPASTHIEGISADLAQELNGMKVETAKMEMNKQRLDRLENSLHSFSEQEKGLIVQLEINRVARTEHLEEVETLSVALDGFSDLMLSEREDDLRHMIENHLRPPVDLVLLLNPAMEAISSFNLISAMNQVQSTPVPFLKRPDVPWIVSITSRADDATKRLFPQGVAVGRMLRPPLSGRTEFVIRESRDDEPCINVRLGSLLSQTAGHLDEMISHKVAGGDRQASVFNGKEDGDFGIFEGGSGCPNSDYWIVSAGPEFYQRPWKCLWARRTSASARPS